MIVLFRAAFLRRVGLLMMLIIGLAACADAGDPTETTADYLTKRVAGDAEALGRLACGDWEAEAIEQAESFKSLEAEIEGLSCSKDGEDGDYTLVACTGTLKITYDAETRDQPLAATYRMIEEDGEWRVCGEA